MSKKWGPCHLDACTEGDTCENGACLPGSPVDCTDGNECTDDPCSPDLGCVHVPNQSACADGDVCTTGDKCVGGECVSGVAVNCDDANGCTDDSCEPTTGCLHLPNTETCDDGDACTEGDGCVDDSCQGGPIVNCDDLNPCTEDSCDIQTGCQHAPLTGSALVQPGPAEGMDHVIGSVYNIDPDGTMDFIRAGGWGDDYYALLRFPLESLPVTASQATIRLFAMWDTTDPTEMYLDRVTSAWSEEIAWWQKPAYVNVDTIPSCTEGEWYEIDVTDLYNGWKSSEYPNWGIQLRSVGTWNNYNAFWSSDYAEDPSLWPMLVVDGGGGSCDDGNACTSGDLCVDGQCVASAAIACDDLNPCTNDSCEPLTGCVHKFNSLLCEDGDLCTEVDVCLGGQCISGPPVVCNDSNPCTADSCSSSLGCVFKPTAGSCPGGTCVNGTCCQPQCAGKQCGDDGCGGVCGDCGTKTCMEGQCVSEVTLFYDGFEGGEKKWNLGWVWSKAWVPYEGALSLQAKDDPWDYSCNYISKATMLSGINLNNTEAAQLAFVYKSKYETWNVLVVVASADGGQTWTEISNYLPPSTSWQSLAVDLSSLLGAADLRLGFSYYQDCGGSAGEWWIDEVTVTAWE